MSSASFSPWLPLPEVPAMLEIEGVKDENDGLEIFLRGEVERTFRFSVVFPSFVAYRNIRESFRLRTWQAQGSEVLTSLRIAERSLWIDWLVRESGDLLLMSENLVHYCVYTYDDCLDIVANKSPRAHRLDGSL